MDLIEPVGPVIALWCCVINLPTPLYSKDWEKFLAASDAAPGAEQAALSNLDKDIDVGEGPTEENAFQSGGTDLVESMTVSVGRVFHGLLLAYQPRFCGCAAVASSLLRTAPTVRMLIPHVIHFFFFFSNRCGRVVCAYPV